MAWKQNWESAMSSEGFLTSNSSGTTWVKPYGQGWKEVTYSVVDGLAVFEGCIILGTVTQAKAVKEFIDNNAGMRTANVEPFGTGIVGAQFRWKNNILPYEIDAGLPNQQRVLDAIKHWESNTPIRFVKRDTANNEHRDYVVFRPGNGCASSVGRRGGRQDIILGSVCSTGNCIHEIGHTVGLWHEQSRQDREQFITINWPSIIPEARHNFDQHIRDGMDLGSYDYESIMHYPRDAFSADGQDTITPKEAGVQIGQRIKLSAGDIASVQKLIS
jgi:hypothetical protein